MDFDKHLQAPARLRILATATAVSEVEFAVLRDQLGTSDSVLSKHLATLADAGYVTSRKGVHEGRRTTWIAATNRGRKALAAHVAALRAVIDGV